MILALLEQIENVPTFLLKKDILSLQIVADLLVLLLDGLTPSVNLLEQNLDKMGLASAQLLHFL